VSVRRIKFPVAVRLPDGVGVGAENVNRLHCHFVAKIVTGRWLKRHVGRNIAMVVLASRPEGRSPMSIKWANKALIALCVTLSIRWC